MGVYTLTTMQLVSWNVNGIRAGIKKGFWTTITTLNPDIVCLQETKAHPENVPPTLDTPTDYYTYWNSAKRSGYSGTATFSRPRPNTIYTGLGEEQFDIEGRVLTTTYPAFTLVNTYFPHTGRGLDRLQYKLDFSQKVYAYLAKLINSKERVIVCGDLNIAHQALDLARPKDNTKNAGFLPEERAWMDKFLSLGLVDTFRYFYPHTPEAYTWWSQQTRARAKNIGWRIDYFLVSKNLLPQLTSAFILPTIMGSDHCPVGITLDLNG